MEDKLFEKHIESTCSNMTEYQEFRFWLLSEYPVFGEDPISSELIDINALMFESWLASRGIKHE